MPLHHPASSLPIAARRLKEPLMTALGPRISQPALTQMRSGSRPEWWFAILSRALLLLFLFPLPGPAQTNEPKRVLILLEEDVSWPIYRLIDENVRATLRNGLSERVLIFSEHLDLIHFPDADSQAQKKAWIQRKYANSRLDLVVEAGDIPTDIFPNVPLVYLNIRPQGTPPRRLEFHEDAAAVWIELGAGKTIEAARRFQPNAQQVVVIAGNSPAEAVLLDRVRQQLAGDSQQIPITYLTNVGFPELLHKVETLGPQSIVLYVAFARDKDGRLFISADVSKEIAAVSSAPVYALFDPAIGSGAVGGYATRFGEMGTQAGELGLQFLSGGHPKDLMARSNYLFDWRQLQRWKIPESALPPGSILIYRQPTVWEIYRRYILGAVLIFLIQTLLILGLLWQRSRKREFQNSLLDKIAFERMLADLSTTFINLPEQQINQTIDVNLGRIGQLLHLERVTRLEFDHSKAELMETSSWHSQAIPQVPARIQGHRLPWCGKLLFRGEPVFASELGSLPDDAAAEKEHFGELGIVSIALVPLKAGDQNFGAISFATAKRRIPWTEDLAEQLKLVAEIFSNALIRKLAQETRFKHAALVESSEDAIISETLDGRILSWNAGAERLFEFSEAEVVGRPVTIIIPEEMREEENTILRLSRSGETTEHYETVRVAKSGKRLDVSLTVSPIRDSAGTVVAASKIARDITQKKQAEQALRKSEELFRQFMDHSPAVAWMKDEEGHYIYVSEIYLQQLNVRPEDRLGKTDFSLYPRAIAEEFQKNDRLALALGYPIEVTEESIDAHGEPCTWLAYKFPFRDASGQLFVGGIGIDVTERKKARESLQTLTGRLISAQEEERARLARELHDDFSQRLALLGIGLGQLWKTLPSENVAERQKVMDMLRGTRELMSDLHNLSHELHSSRLEHVGLVSALNGLCKEISERHKIAVRFNPCPPPPIPKDVALCLFRVAQESLANVIKHSGAKEARVELGANTSGISLRISDPGRGFDPGKGPKRAGIGLIGMTERLRLVGGRLSVTSQPDCGTEIFAEVPLAAAVSEVQVKTHASGK